MKLARQALVGWLCCHALSCVDLPYVEPGICGNGVLDPGEDCDSYAPAELHQRCLPPGSPGACHFDCSPSDATVDAEPDRPSCPEAMSCGLDGICRASSGLDFETWGSYPSVQANSLLSGDLDGNGYADLLLLGNPNHQWETVPRVLFFDDEGAKDTLYEPQTAMRSLSLSPLIPTPMGERAREQIVGVTHFGIAALESNSAQEVFSVPNPLHSMPDNWKYRMARVRGVSDSPLHERVLIYDAEGNLSAGYSPPLLAIMGRSVDEMSGDLVAGNFVDSDDSPCDELTVAFHGDSAVYGLSICDTAGRFVDSPVSPHSVASLPNGAGNIVNHTLALIDDDAHLDLLVITDTETTPVYVAFGRGDGTFVANPAYPNVTQGVLWPVAGPLETLTAEDARICSEPWWLGNDAPLAIGDLNADGHSDWVLPRGLAMRTERIAFDVTNGRVGLEVCAGNVPFGRTWSIAAIADLNSDGRADLVAGSSRSSGLDLLLATGLDRLNPFEIRTSGPVQHLITGDYNGDLTPDVAFVQELPVESGVASFTHSLAIAFGEYRGIPQEPISVARFATLSVEQLMSANYETDDGIEEIGLLTRNPDHFAQQLTLFIGNGGHHPISSLGLWAFTEQMAPEVGIPITATVGRFLDLNSPSILALASDDCPAQPCPNRLWFVHNNSGTLEQPIFSTELAPTIAGVDDPSAARAVYLIAGPLGRSKNGATQFDDALLLAPSSDPEELGVWRVGLPDPIANEFEPFESPETPLVTIFGVLTPSSAPTLVDLDGDGLRDLVLLLRDPAQGEQRLHVVWNGPSSFDNENVQELSLADAAVNGLAVGNFPLGQRLYAVTTEGVFRIEATEAREVTQSQVYGPRYNGHMPVRGGNALVVEDLTGDGLPDLAVSGTGGLRIYSGIPDIQ